jgi:hypothetical protein
LQTSENGCLHLNASKSAKTPFFEKKIEIENFYEKKSGFIGGGGGGKPFVTSYFRGF